MSSFFSALGFLFIIVITALTFVQPSTAPMLFIETIKPWPPELGQVYPDLDLIDQDGRSFKLSEYKGRTILLQPAGINCSPCQAFSGSARAGAYRKVPAQVGLDSIYEMLPKYTKGLKFPNPDVVFIQILFYGISFEKPTQEDASGWAKHFGFKVAEGAIVAFSPNDLRSEKTYGLIPGFQLIDKNFILQADSTGPDPEDDLFKTLLPMVPIAINAKKR